MNGCAVLAVVTLFLPGACGGSTSPEVTYKPELLPVTIEIGPDGITLRGDTSVITPIGEFSIGAKYQLPDHDKDTIYVVVRDRKKGTVGFDDVYELATGQGDFTAVVNGTTTIEIHDRQVIIDVTGGTVPRIQFKRSGPPAGSAKPSSAWASVQRKWSTGYRTSWYKPFMLSRWAYDDSTITKWYGIGFVWFLVRLVLALVLGVLDLILTVVFLIAQVLYMVTGSTGRNVVWGVFVLLVLLCATLIVSAVRDA